MKCLLFLRALTLYLTVRSDSRCHFLSRVRYSKLAALFIRTCNSLRASAVHQSKALAREKTSHKRLDIAAWFSMLSPVFEAIFTSYNQHPEPKGLEEDAIFTKTWATPLQVPEAAFTDDSGLNISAFPSASLPSWPITTIYVYIQSKGSTISPPTTTECFDSTALAVRTSPLIKRAALKFLHSESLARDGSTECKSPWIIHKIWDNQ